MRRREDIQAEISRVQDVLEALESFEAPGGGKDGGSNSGANSGSGGVKAGASSGGYTFEWQVLRRLATQKAGHSPDQTGIRSMTRRFGP